LCGTLMISAPTQVSAPSYAYQNFIFLLLGLLLVSG
jgi:hypothetical protein